ncbi:MAG: hypothetical protein ACK4WH_03270 [Phycisphaerales bacterium]
MAFNIRPGEAYTIRRKVLKFFGAAFHIYDPQGGLVGFCKQKAFKLKEDLRIYTDEACTTELIVIKARSIIDFGAVYDVTLPDGNSLGSFRRKGFTSSFLRDHWLVFDASGVQAGEVIEQGGFLPFARRYIDLVSLFFPQKYEIRKLDGAVVARYRQHFNIFVYRLSIAVDRDDEQIDDLVILAGGCLICAIEGRQNS